MQTRELSMEHPRGFCIHRKLGEFEAALLNGVGRHDMKTGYVWYYLKDEATNPGPLNVGRCFFNGTLKIVSLSVRDEDLGTSWDDFSEETEHPWGGANGGMASRAWIPDGRTCLGQDLGWL